MRGNLGGKTFSVAPPGRLARAGGASWSRAPLVAANALRRPVRLAGLLARLRARSTW